MRGVMPVTFQAMMVPGTLLTVTRAAAAASGAAVRVEAGTAETAAGATEVVEAEISRRLLVQPLFACAHLAMI